MLWMRPGAAVVQLTPYGWCALQCCTLTQSWSASMHFWVLTQALTWPTTTLLAACHGSGLGVEGSGMLAWVAAALPQASLWLSTSEPPMLPGHQPARVLWGRSFCLHACLLSNVRCLHCRLLDSLPMLPVLVHPAPRRLQAFWQHLPL